MRSIWKGSIAFGLVNVPVKVYSATEDHDLKFHQVHAKDNGRVRYKRVCEECPVQSECLEFALENRIDHGVWGGTSERQRRRIIKARLAEGSRKRLGRRSADHVGTAVGQPVRIGA